MALRCNLLMMLLEVWCVASIASGGVLLAIIDDISIGYDNIHVFLIVLIVSSSFQISFFGCCEDIRDMSACLIYTLSMTLMILLIASSMLGALILVKMDEKLRVIDNGMRTLWANRGQKSAVWDTVQRGLQCCGLNAANEWGSSLPKSCCPGTGQCVISNAFPRGCSLVINDNLFYNDRILAYMFLGLVVITLIGFVFSCIMVNSVRRSHRGRV